jgi:hypothetical protein
MTDKKILIRSAGAAILATLYIAIISYVMTNVGPLLGPDKDVFAPVAFLLIFVLSAATMGALILGKPILLYLDGEKLVAIKLFVATIGWLVVLVFLVICAAIRF